MIRVSLVIFTAAAEQTDVLVIAFTVMYANRTSPLIDSFTLLHRLKFSVQNKCVTRMRLEPKS